MFHLAVSRQGRARPSRASVGAPVCPTLPGEVCAITAQTPASQGVETAGAGAGEGGRKSRRQPGAA